MFRLLVSSEHFVQQIILQIQQQLDNDSSASNFSKSTYGH